MVGEILKATASFLNPLPVPLRKGRFLIDGPGLQEQMKIKLNEEIEQFGEASCEFSMIPQRAGKATIAVKFYSRELEDVDGFDEFMVKMYNEI